ncbi:hypothetical protein GGR57DRAFT_479260 [Xylariaceae sp. FL1272]|nr:hypothetical protein GGR57DRAFT_479260 [Xylariaceae sp. FL1272]
MDETLGRDGLRRSIGLVLEHVGFDAAREDALESFTELVETYTITFINDIKQVANGSRRLNPTAADFDKVLRNYNIPISSLKPHLKNPVRKDKLEPTFYDPIAEDTTNLALPPIVLGDELDGKHEKEERTWIPAHFPSFPSKHAYRWTPAPPKEQNTPEKRAKAQADARKGEMALRRIDRAAKITRQKELKEVAQRGRFSKKRHDAWEDLMRSLLPNNGGSNGALEIADHSTIVDAGAKYARKEIPRSHRRIDHAN